MYLLALFIVQNRHGHPLCTWFPKQIDRGDFCRLNLVTTSDKYPLPNMQDLSNGLHGCTVISKIDLVKDYHQRQQSLRHLVCSNIFTPFGLSNAAQTFQRMIFRTTDGLEGVFAYMEGSRVGSLDRQIQLRLLEAFFSALATHGLAIKVEPDCWLPLIGGAQLCLCCCRRGELTNLVGHSEALREDRRGPGDEVQVVPAG